MLWIGDSRQALNLRTVVVSAKTTSDASTIPASSFPPNPNSPQSTINTVAREITEAGGFAIPLPVDVRDVENVKDLVDETTKYLHSPTPISSYNCVLIVLADDSVPLTY